MDKPNFDEADVPQEAINEFVAAGDGLRQGYMHFLKGFSIATECLAKDYGGFEELKNPKDQDSVFKAVRAKAKEFVKLPLNTFNKYCKIARYCIIYHASWDMASDANRNDLRWCKNRIIKFKIGTKQEKMQRAWEERLNYKKVENDKKKKEEDEWLKDNGHKEPELVHIPLPKNGESEDDYWLGYISSQVKHIQKHMDILNGGGEIKTIVLHFLGSALPIIKKHKPK